MNHRPRKSPIRAVPPAYRQTFERLNTALEQNTPSINTKKIRLMREAYFADVDKLQKSGSVVLPK